MTRNTSQKRQMNKSSQIEALSGLDSGFARVSAKAHSPAGQPELFWVILNLSSPRDPKVRENDVGANL